MIATGGSATAALEVLKKSGIKEEQIIFASVVSAPEGLAKIRKDFPGVKVMVAQEDPVLNDVFI